MKKHKAAKKPAAKKGGALKKIAAKAIKLVKGKSKAKPAAKKPQHKAAPAKPAAATNSHSHPHAQAHAKSAHHGHARPKPARGSFRPLAGGSLMSESDIRRMPESAYMNDTQLEFFRQRLLQMRTEVVDREVDVKERLHQRESFADPADRATAEEEHWLDLRLRERESLLLRKIDDALRRIRDREYGYCEITGEPIGIPRLLARPTATLSLEAQERRELRQKLFGD